MSLESDYNITLCLDETVEILDDEEDEFKEIEPLTFEYKNMYGNISQHRQSERDLIDAINDLIENQNKLIERFKDIKDER